MKRVLNPQCSRKINRCLMDENNMQTQQEPLFDEHDEQLGEKANAARKSTLVSVVVNAFLSTGQILTGLLAGSQGLVADGIHSLSDLVADFVVLIANHKSQAAPDEDHPYGHYRYENAASLILGALLLVVGIGMLLSAIHKIHDPEAIPAVHMSALWVALIALVAKETLFRYMLAVAKRVKSSMLAANAWHARSDAASSLVVAAGIVGNLCGYKLLDPVAAIIVGIMICKMGGSFGLDALHDLMDRAADLETETAIKQTIMQAPGVRGLHDFKTRKMGDLVLVDVHVEVDGQLSVREGHDIVLEARNRVLAKHDVLNMMTHIDPV